MTRPIDWTPIWSGDPIPGLPDGVSGAADTYGRTAGNIDTAAGALLSLTDGVGMRSDAIDAFQAKALQVRTDILKTQSRYAAASSVLSAYAGHLRQAQADSLRLLAAAQLTQHDHDLAQYRMQHAHDQATHATDPLTKTQALTAVNHQKALRDQAGHDISAYSSQLAAVVAGRQAAARVAIQGLDDADTTSAVRGDTYMDKLKHEAHEILSTVEQIAVALKEATDKVAKWIVDHADTITKILDIISTALTVLAIVAVFVFPAAAPILMTLSKVVQAASTVVGGLKVASIAYLVATHQRPVSELVDAAVGLGVSLALSYGGGKLRSAGSAIEKSALKKATAKATTNLTERNLARGISKSATMQIKGSLGGVMTVSTACLRKIKPKFVSQVLIRSISDEKGALQLSRIVTAGPVRLGYTSAIRDAAGSSLLRGEILKGSADVMDSATDYFDASGKAATRIDDFFRVQRRVVCPLPVGIPTGVLA